MENEGNENIINLNEEFEQNIIFNLDYPEQNITNNKKYKLWKESILKIYGDDAKLFRCINDKIIFYSSNDNNIEDSIYLCKCPICKKIICYFCSRIDILNNMCCYKRSIYDLYFKNGFSFIKKVKKYEDMHYISEDYTILLKREVYLDRYYRNGYGYFFAIPCFLMVFLFSVVFFALNFYIILFIILISIPFKLYPLKYYLAIASSF